jgi:hypothetical protein
VRAGTSQIPSALDSSSLMIPQTPNSVETTVETVAHVGRNTEAMMGAAGFVLRC